MSRFFSRNIKVNSCESRGEVGLFQVFKQTVTVAFIRTSPCYRPVQAPKDLLCSIYVCLTISPPVSTPSALQHNIRRPSKYWHQDHAQAISTRHCKICTIQHLDCFCNQPDIFSELFIDFSPPTLVKSKCDRVLSLRKCIANFPIERTEQRDRTLSK